MGGKYTLTPAGRWTDEATHPVEKDEKHKKQSYESNVKEMFKDVMDEVFEKLAKPDTLDAPSKHILERFSKGKVHADSGDDNEEDTAARTAYNRHSVKLAGEFYPATDGNVSRLMLEYTKEIVYTTGVTEMDTQIGMVGCINGYLCVNADGYLVKKPWTEDVLITENTEVDIANMPETMVIDLDNTQTWQVSEAYTCDFDYHHIAERAPHLTREEISDEDLYRRCEDMLCDRDVRIYVLTLLVLRVLGTPLRRSVFLKGPPGCGKSTILSLLCMSFGARVKRYSGAALTNDSTGNMSAMLKAQNGKAIMLVDELSGTICESTLKTMTNTMPQGDRTPHSGTETIISQTAMPVGACNDEVLQKTFSDGVLDKVDIIAAPFFKRPTTKLGTDFSQNAVYGSYALHMLKYCIAHYNTWVKEHGAPTSNISPPAALTESMETFASKPDVVLFEGDVTTRLVAVLEHFRGSGEKYFKAGDVVDAIKTKYNGLFHALNLHRMNYHKDLKAAMFNATGGNHFKQSGHLRNGTKLNACFKNWFPVPTTTPISATPTASTSAATPPSSDDEDDH